MSYGSRSAPRLSGTSLVWPLVLLVIGLSISWRLGTIGPHVGRAPAVDSGPRIQKGDGDGDTVQQGETNSDESRAEAQPREVLARSDLAADDKANISIYERVSPSVVFVATTASRSVPLFLDAQRIVRGTGSGFVWDKEGHIVTNYHVVKGAETAQVTLADHSTYDGRQIWAHPEKDIAVLAIDAPPDKLFPIDVGTSHDLKVGQLTFAIGDPFGLDQTMTNGIISALGREIEGENEVAIHGTIQTSAPINPGNSGGPLLDSAGRLIGMTTAILSPSGAFAGIGFAIPVDEVNRVVPQLIQHGKVVHARLGVQLAEDQLAQQLGVTQGALIIKVLPNTPAAAAGLQGTERDAFGQFHRGDVIEAINGQSISSGKQLYSVLDEYKVGNQVTLTIRRQGEKLKVAVTLAAVE